MARPSADHNVTLPSFYYHCHYPLCKGVFCPLSLLTPPLSISHFAHSCGPNNSRPISQRHVQRLRAASHIQPRCGRPSAAVVLQVAYQPCSDFRHRADVCGQRVHHPVAEPVGHHGGVVTCRRQHPQSVLSRHRRDGRSGLLVVILPVRVHRCQQPGCKHAAVAQRLQRSDAQARYTRICLTTNSTPHTTPPPARRAT